MWLADAAEVVFTPGNKKQLTSHPRRAPFLSQNLISSIMDDPEGGTGSGAEVEMEGRQVKKVSSMKLQAGCVRGVRLVYTPLCLRRQ